MFCSKCGKNLEEGVKFCDECGTHLDIAQVETEKANNQSNVITANPTFQEFTKSLKGFFSKDTVKTVGMAARSTGNEWSIFAFLSTIIYAFALSINIKQMMDSLLGTLSSVIGSEIYNFGTCFFYGILISVGTFLLMGFAIFGAMKLILKKSAGMKNIFNLVSVASLPMSLAHLLNMLVGFVYWPAILILSTVSILATAILLYVGIQKLDKLEKSPFLAYISIWTVVVSLVIIIVSVVTKNIVQGLFEGMMSSTVDGLFGSGTSDTLGGISDFLDMFS